MKQTLIKTRRVVVTFFFFLFSIILTGLIGVLQGSYVRQVRESREGRVLLLSMEVSQPAFLPPTGSNISSSTYLSRLQAYSLVGHRRRRTPIIKKKKKKKKKFFFQKKKNFFFQKKKKVFFHIIKYGFNILTWVLQAKETKILFVTLAVFCLSFISHK